MLLTSEYRNNWFYNQIKKACPDKICLDIGTGSGILSLFAIHSGAKHVYMIDHNLDCCEMASDIFEYNNIPKEKYTIIHDEFDSSLAKTLPSIDVIVSETINGMFFNVGHHTICKTIQNTPSLKDATMIPDKIYGSLTFFKDINSIEAVEQLFKKRDTIKKIHTGVEHIDNEYTISSNIIDKNFYQDRELHPVLQTNHLLCRPWVNPHSKYEKIMLNIWQDAIASACYTTDDVIKYNTYNPPTTLEWQTNIDIPDNVYGIRLNGFLECERTNSARLEMYKEVWPTHFYKFTKVNNNLKIQFNDTNINNFVFI